MKYSSDDGCLFTRKQMYILSCSESGKVRYWLSQTDKVRKEVCYNNMHLAGDMTFTRENGFAIMQPYTGTTDFVPVLYTERKKAKGNGQLLHFFTADHRFRNQAWFDLERFTYFIRKFDYYTTPDFSMWRNTPTEYYNKEAVFKTRLVGAYWQQCGYDVIPTASWGGMNSFSYCFEGLPTHSVIAVSGMGNSKDAAARDLWCYGIQRLEAEKAPLLILVYGEEVDVPGIHTPLKFFPDFISKRLRKL